MGSFQQKTKRNVVLALEARTDQRWAVTEKKFCGEQGVTQINRVGKKKRDPNAIKEIKRESLTLGKGGGERGKESKSQRTYPIAPQKEWVILKRRDKMPIELGSSNADAAHKQKKRGKSS